MPENKMTIDQWLLRGRQEPDFEMRLAIYEELRAKRGEIENLRTRLETGHWPSCGVGEGTHRGECDCGDLGLSR